MELKASVTEKVQAVVKKLFGLDVDVVLTVPEEQFGDFSTNVAMQLAGKIGESPRAIAEKITSELTAQALVADIAGPGFINLRVSDSDLWGAAQSRNTDVFAGKVFVVEYSCPNYFKELHAGHLYQTVVADVVARLIERSGAQVRRTNFGADVGLSAARAMWGILNDLGGEFPEKLQEIPKETRTKYIAARYVDGATADSADDDEATKTAIMAINKQIYTIHKEGDTTSNFAKIYFTCREWSREYFVNFYYEIKVTDFEKYYPESITEGRGVSTVNAHIGTVFKESRGAVIFDGEPHGVDTRVFITSQGLPTYEAKDIGLILIEADDFHFDHRILFTGRDQLQYMKVVWKALDQIIPGSEAKMTHIVNGIVKFGDGQKMSSRTGNVTTAVDVVQAVREAVGDSGDATRDDQISLGAMKYEFLRHRLEGDIAFDPKESVSLQGNSGPYLQYALVRAKSVVVKSSAKAEVPNELQPDERALVRKLAEYQLVIDEATRQYEAHSICNYLYELAGQFNKFYEKNLIVGDPRESFRLAIVNCYVDTLTDGLSVLGIQAPEKM